MKKSPAIRVQNLQILYNERPALSDVNLEIPTGKITALIGASGSGKTSFLRALNRILDVTPFATVHGDIFVEGQNIHSKETDVISLRRTVGMVFQNPTPFPKSIYDNIVYGLEVQGQKKKAKKWWEYLRPEKISAQEVEKSNHPLDKAVVESLKEAALWDEVKDRLHQSAFKLSGGQQQRLCIARAIAVRPKILLLDEPCSSLDPVSTKKIEKLFLRLKKKYTIVIVTHNLQQARRVSDMVGFFHLGELIEFGATKKIFEKADKKLTRAYVGGNFG